MYALAARAGCLLTHGAAAGATGAAILASVPVAEAKIIYTPVNIKIQTLVWIDFEGPQENRHHHPPRGRDADFAIVRGAGCPSTVCRSAIYAKGYGYGSNAIADIDNGWYAVALRRGERMGPNKYVKGRGQMALVGHDRDGTGWYGQWANGGKGLQNGYLGLKFTLKGETHYGWARVSLTVKNGWFDTATLSGYAFETIPDKPIIVGKIHGPDVVTMPPPGTLGRLALGRK
jgi:hypothetical protein